MMIIFAIDDTLDDTAYEGQASHSHDNAISEHCQPSQPAIELAIRHMAADAT